MATVSIKIFKHHFKEDGTCNVKIVIYHKGERKYLDTTHYVSKKQINGSLEIKDKFLLRILNGILDDYRQSISDLGFRLDFFSCEDLKKYLLSKDQEIDFLTFSQDYIDQLRKEGRKGTADNHRTVLNSLKDYFGREAASINEIHSNMLNSYERYLRTERVLIRTNQLQKNVRTVKKGLTDSGLHNHMRDLRTMFNAACKEFNNEDLGLFRIKHQPFKRYKMGSPPLTKKRNNTIDEVVLIKNCEVLAKSRAELAKDLYMLSFYLCGMNAVDLYYLSSKNLQNGRIYYNRSKTAGRRKDKAFISVKIVDEAKPLLEKYIGKLPFRYGTYDGLDTALSQGMKQLRKLTGVSNTTMYWARHTFATIARNICRLSKDDVSMALNHVDTEHRTTDIYIEKDWSIIDDVQMKVVEVVRKFQRSSVGQKAEPTIHVINN